MSHLTRHRGIGAIPLIFMLVACSSPATSPSTTEGQSTGESTAPGADGSVVEITVATDTGSALKFDPAQITVPAGATVRLTFSNKATVPHNLTFDDPIGAATENVVDPGASQTIEFTAPDPGEYTFVCTLHPGMDGTLVVEGGS
jgi:plastocyanin